MNHHAVGPAPGRDLDLLLAGGSVVGLGDGALLARIVAGPGPLAEAAFAALIQRHGAMVARVCRGILGDAHAAEDAAQAVFLVLARRAKSIRDPDRLASWLYGVALRTAREARRRQPRDQAPTTIDEATMIDPLPNPAATLIRREQADLLYGAIARLPRRYLIPVVLCDLEGLIHAEAAAQLGCPVATVSIRLKRAKDKLRSALARHRLDFESALPPVAAISLPRTLLATASAQLLANRVLWTASTAKWPAVLVAALLAGVAAVGSQSNPQAPQAAEVGVVGTPVEHQDPPQPKPTPAPPETTPAPAPATPGIKVGFPTVRGVANHKDFVGQITASRTVELRSQVSGVVLTAEVAEGDRVEADQVLFRIGDPADDNQLREARGQRTKLVAKAEKIARVTRNTNDPAEIHVRKQIADLNNQIADLAAQAKEAGLQANPVFAPFAGQVNRRPAEVGVTVEAARTPLATISTDDPVRVDFNVAEADYIEIRRWLRTKPGISHLPVRVALMSKPSSTQLGRVVFRATEFATKGLEQPGRDGAQIMMACTLHAEVPNPDHALIPGLTARVRVEYGDPRPAVMVPVTAFGAVGEVRRPFEPSPGDAPDANQAVTVVAEDGSVGVRWIKVDLQRDHLLPDGMHREVLAGLDARTRIVLDLNSAKSLRPGSIVPVPIEVAPK